MNIQFARKIDRNIEKKKNKKIEIQIGRYRQQIDDRKVDNRKIDNKIDKKDRQIDRYIKRQTERQKKKEKKQKFRQVDIQAIDRQIMNRQKDRQLNK